MHQQSEILNSNISFTCPHNQTLHIVSPSPGLVHYRYLYICGGSCPLMEFCEVQNSLCVQVLRSPILAELLHGTQAVVGWPSHSASAHILV